MKKLIVKIAALFTIVLFATVSWGAESVTQSLQAGGQIQVLQMVWVTDSSGNLTATDTAYPIEGFLIMVETDPDSPTTLYDITLKDANGLDVMGGALGDRSATATEVTLPLMNGNYTMIPVYGTLSMDVTGAGNDESGTIRIYFVR